MATQHLFKVKMAINNARFQNYYFQNYFNEMLSFLQLSSSFLCSFDLYFGIAIYRMFQDALLFMWQYEVSALLSNKDVSEMMHIHTIIHNLLQTLLK